MIDKIRLLEIGARRISSEKDFMSFILNKYIEIENISEAELISLLKCSFENFYKLALCKAPDVNAKDFIDRLKNISEYSEISFLELNKIIKRVDTISKLSSIECSDSFLMAARDRREKENKD